MKEVLTVGCLQSLLLVLDFAVKTIGKKKKKQVLVSNYID